MRSEDRPSPPDQDISIDTTLKRPNWNIFFGCVWLALDSVPYKSYNSIATVTSALTSSLTFLTPPQRSGEGFQYQPTSSRLPAAIGWDGGAWTHDIQINSLALWPTELHPYIKVGKAWRTFMVTFSITRPFRGGKWYPFGWGPGTRTQHFLLIRQTV